MTTKPKIYAFSNVVGGGEGEAYGMAEDGTILASHYCSNERYVPHDLGVTSDWKHEHYKKHYPDGYELEFVATRDIESHQGLQAAFALSTAAAGKDEVA